MSQHGHELMEPVAADDPAVSTSASPPRRDSIEDADSSLTRKRPRLDDSSKNSCSMSPDTVSPAASSASPPERPIAMTIRSQPPPSAQSANNRGDNTTAPASGTPVMEMDTAEEHEQPEGSPPIEIVDDGLEALMTRYPPGKEESYFRRFPYAEHDGDYLSAIRRIIHHVHSAGQLDSTALGKVVVWLQNFPHVPTQWQAFYVHQAPFWDEFSNLVYRALARKHHFGDVFCDDDQSVEQIFYEFFQACVIQHARLLEVDGEMLSRCPAGETYNAPLLSQKLIRHLVFMVRPEKPAVFQLLQKEYGINPTGMRTRLLYDFVSANGIQHLVRFATEVCHRVTGVTQNMLGIYVSQLLSIIGCFLQDSPEDTVIRSELHRGALRVFREFNSHLQVPSNISDTSATRELIAFLATLLFEICHWDAVLAAELLDEFLDFGDPDSPNTAPEHFQANATHDALRSDPSSFPVLIMNAWKFKLLRKYVVKGRMDLRVMSISTMDTALVEIWREYSVTEQSVHHPVMQYLADFLLHERVVNYIVSVDSHHQIISRSGNIVGFLVVTHRYSNSQTDAIWNTVSKSPDPNVVTATMILLRAIFSLMETSDQMYLCEKLYELPIETYNADILRFLRELTTKLTTQYIDWSKAGLKSRPWNVCIRVMQDAFPANGSHHGLALHMDAQEQLKGLSKVPFIPFEERCRIYQDCAACIMDRSPKSTGSVRVIYILATTFLMHDASFFKQNPEISRQILKELCSFVKTGTHNTDSQLVAFQYRLDFLVFLLMAVEEAIPPDFYEDLWKHTVGEHAPTSQHRDISWRQFSYAVSQKPANEFCKQLIYTHVPELEPQHYTDCLFEFVAGYEFPTTWKRIITDGVAKELLQIRGADLLWKFILNAPKDTIETRSADLLANRYLEIDTASGVSLGEMEAAHIALVEHCTEELLSAHKSLRAHSDHHPDKMDLVSSDPEKCHDEMRFCRTLLFERQLLLHIRSKPEFNRSRRADSKVEPLEIDMPHGDPLEIQYQVVTAEKKILTMGTDNTLADLYRRLCLETGCSEIKLFAKGQRLNKEDFGNKNISSLANGLVIVQKSPNSEPILYTADSTMPGSVFETAIQKQFNRLFECMDADDLICLKLYDFLRLFPVSQGLIQDIMSGKATAKDMFPPGKPYKAQYAAHAISVKLEEQLRKGCLDDTFLSNSIRLLDQALLDPDLISTEISSPIEFELAGALVRCLLRLLKERPQSENPPEYFSNECALVARLIKILHVDLDHSSDGNYALWAYASILEASLHSRGVWKAFMDHPDTIAIHKTLLLAHSSKELRSAIAKSIASINESVLPSTCPLDAGEIAYHFWIVLSAILPETVFYPHQSEQLFLIAEQIFRRHNQDHRDEESLQSVLSTWSGLMLQYTHGEIVGRDEKDHVVQGFTRLLLYCVSSLKSFKKPLNASTLMKQLFHKFLHVPTAADREEHADGSVQMPILESSTRKELYDLMLALAEDRSSFDTLIGLSECLSMSEPNVYEQSHRVEREQEIRSGTGYVGLHNPRAICYMNSLVTQLFMNLNFRRFMLGLDVADADCSQRLLSETQRLFGQMQNSYRKAADPRPFAACVRSPEGQQIDINVQMDADEFYNLLFDQWEGQMLSDKDKHHFKSFYGGKTVTQIKSKECDHVSERVEDFFVVQCDVKGKANLHESLKAFVEGDVMEGDNKYKCESCDGKHVDAVKRTCLKEVPNNLIFHLKRFDFDLNEFRKIKINDTFEFPNSIDVSSYNIEHLSDITKPQKEDVFDLVGILVHSGTSENGHYWSYIRVRPDAPKDSPRWLEFNDREVDPFDPATIPFHTYGGPVDEYHRQLKHYSAYMLFYERRTVSHKDQAEPITSTRFGEPKVPLPLNLEREINQDNEAFVKEYSLFDPNHSRFVRQFLQNLRTVNHGICSETHEQESRVLHVVMEHLSLTLCRLKTADLFEETISQTRKVVLSCPLCCHIALKWLASHEYALFNLLLRADSSRVRSQSRTFLIDCLRTLRDKDPVLYGIEMIDTDMDDDISSVDSVLAPITNRLRLIADVSYASLRWDDFYLTLCQLNDLGIQETAALLNSGMMDFCLNVFGMHAVPSLQVSMPEIWKFVDGRRKIFNRMTEFLYRLLTRMNIRLPNIDDADHVDRLDTCDNASSNFPLTKREKQLLFHWHDENKAFAVLDKAIEQYDPKTEIFYPGEILKWMCSSPDRSMQDLLYLTVTEGVISLDPPSCDPYVRAALSFCQANPMTDKVEQTIDVVASSTLRLKDKGGEVHLGFFAGLLASENQYLFDRKHENIFYEHCLVHARKYAICLLLYPDETIRRNTASFVRRLFMSHVVEDGPAQIDMLLVKYKAARALIELMFQKIIEEHSSGTSRAWMAPMMHCCDGLVQTLHDLAQRPEVEAVKQPGDNLLPMRFTKEVEHRWHHWPVEEGTPISAGETYDHSDYGSESEVDAAEG